MVKTQQNQSLESQHSKRSRSFAIVSGFVTKKRLEALMLAYVNSDLKTTVNDSFRDVYVVILGLAEAGMYERSE